MLVLTSTGVQRLQRLGATNMKDLHVSESGDKPPECYEDGTSVKICGKMGWCATDRTAIRYDVVDAAKAKAATQRDAVPKMVRKQGNEWAIGRQHRVLNFMMWFNTCEVSLVSSKHPLGS